MRGFMAAMEAFLKGLGYFKDWYVFQRLRRSPKTEKFLFNLFGIVALIAFFGIVIYYYIEIFGVDGIPLP